MRSFPTRTKDLEFVFPSPLNTSSSYFEHLLRTSHLVLVLSLDRTVRTSIAPFVLRSRHSYTICTHLPCLSSQISPKDRLPRPRITLDHSAVSLCGFSSHTHCKRITARRKVARYVAGVAGVKNATSASRIRKCAISACPRLLTRSRKSVMLRHKRPNRKFPFCSRRRPRRRSALVAR
jgi:hypothetical protein